MKITLGFSPCPNDTFIFDALVNKKIPLDGLEFKVQLEDVQTLNQLALQQTLDITKISYGVLPQLLDDYIVLNSGSALGNGVGPLLIAREEMTEDEVTNTIIAIPGENTTANMLFALAFPGAKHKQFLRYDEIEGFVLNSKESTAGVIIHENRFTYQQKGLKKITDLGDYWQQKTGAAIPLGGIVAKRSIDETILRKVDELISQSIIYAYQHYPELSDYVRDHSQEMEESVMRKHIDLYVNDYSINLGEEGRKAITKFLDVCKSINPSYVIKEEDIFLEA